MKFGCLGYLDVKAWEAMSKAKQDSLVEKCLTYDDELVSTGHWLNGWGAALQGAQTAKTLRWENGKAVTTDGPFAETREVLGGIGVLEAKDMAEAVALMSKHPGSNMGPFEVRPVDEEMLERQLASMKKTDSGNAQAGASKEFACLGYVNEQQGQSIPKKELEAMIAECIAFDEARRKAGHWVRGLKLQSATTAKTVRSKDDKVFVTDGPYAETKEYLGGIVVNRFQDLQQAIDVLTKHPALAYGVTIEVRPINEEFTAYFESRQAARRERDRASRS